jgi:hypothetical protein
MTDDLGPEDRAQLIAESLGIKPSTYMGRTADAIVAMALVAGYPRMSYQDQRDILRVISSDMGFATTNPGFVMGCQGALALMISNPAWVPGSLSNDDLESEITFWRNTSWVLSALGFPGGAYVGAKTRSVLKEIGQGIVKADPKNPPGLKVLTKPIISALKPDALSGVFVFGIAARIVSDSSTSDLEAEAERRGALGAMTPLNASRFGPKHP